uniref:IS3 family transposase n=1 Tax=Paenibacillus sp. FSL H8-0079 TaxID=2921375 RepID=UPI00403FB547
MRVRHDWLGSKFAAVSRSGYYKWRKSRQAKSERRQKEHELESHLLAIHRVYPYFGYLQMTVALHREELGVNHTKVYRVMKQLRFCSVIRRKRRFFGKQASVVNPNRLERQFQASSPRTKLVTDITYIRAGEQFVYLSVIQDLYNNEILDGHLSERNDLALVHETLDRFCQHTDLSGVLLHSSQGFQ